MLVRSLCCCAATHPRHTWMALMVDECSKMPLNAISGFVHVTFSTTTETPKDNTEELRFVLGHKSQSPASTLVFSSSSAPPAAAAAAAAAAAPGRAPGERAHAWVAVARLLCESGDWVRAALVVEGLPPTLQLSARFKAIRDNWPLPRSVIEAWRRGAKRDDNQLTGESLPALASIYERERDSKNAESTTSNIALTRYGEGNPVAQKKCSYTSCRNDELVQMAYNLRKAPSLLSSTSSSSLPAALLQREQHSIVSELRRRGAVSEALQCIVNWQRRQLLRTNAEATEEHANPNATTVGKNEDNLLFDGLGAAKSLLFPGEKSANASGITSAFAAHNSDNTNASATSGNNGEPPRYTAQQLRIINEAAAAHPTLVARCLRDRAVSDRLLRHAGEGVVAGFVFDYLHMLSALAGLARGGGAVKLPARTLTSATTAKAHAVAVLSSSSAHSLLSSASAMDLSTLETYWRTLAALLPLLHPYWRSQSKAEKEKLINALNSALDATQKLAAATREASTRESSAPGERATPFVLERFAGKCECELSVKCRRAIKGSVESVCSPLLHHEPQVRFLRLQVFGEVAVHLTTLHVAIPNALVQCLFLCMAGTCSTSSISGPSKNGNSTASKVQSTLEKSTRAIAEGDISDVSSLRDFLSAAPCDRWLPALMLLHAAHLQHDFRVTAAHTRALLSGLQSTSITRTWTSALRVVAECESSFHITPDERTLPTLLLNLKQRSWQDAFRVLRYVPEQEPVAASPSILRDLQLVALKHASWMVPLRLMGPLKEQHADGFMNYLYCLCAASRGGQTEAAYQYFCALDLGRGRHTAWQGVSPFNELTVAVAAVAMLDFEHYAALHNFAQRVLSMKYGAAGMAKRPEETDATTPPLQFHTLTSDGELMAQAANLAALVECKQYDELADFVIALPADSIKPVLHCFLSLRCLLGMGHLNAPVRLVFDVLGHSSSPQQQRVHRGFLNTVQATQRLEGTFETRQRGTAERRKHLFIPRAHQRRQKVDAARQLGAFVKAKESVLPPQVVQAIAETMMKEGVGAEYMTAALL